MTRTLVTISLACHVWAAQAAIIPRLERGEHLNIVALGTSLSAPSPQNWFAQVGDWLSTRYPGQVTLSNRAVGGTASCNLPQFNRPHGGSWQLDQALANDNPDIVFIEFAINDAYKAFNISVADSRNNLKTMIDRINVWAANNNKAVDVIVQTMNNTGSSYEAFENDVGAYYQGWREEAAANRVLLIDHYPNWINLYNSQPHHAAWKSYVPDDVHPNALGATKVIVPEILRVLNASVHGPIDATSRRVLAGRRLFSHPGIKRQAAASTTSPRKRLPRRSYWPLVGQSRGFADVETD